LFNAEVLAPVPGQAPGARAAKTAAAEEPADPAEEAKARSFASGYDAEMALEFDECLEDAESGPLKLSDFRHSPGGEILGCPAGQEAASRRNEANDGGRAYFHREACDRCLRRWECPVKFTGEFPYISYKDEQVRLAARRAYQETAEFKDRYRWRSDIEATNSHLERIGLKKLHVRGIKAVTFRVYLKVLGLNILRTARFLSKK
jgi:hypothetical protein